VVATCQYQISGKKIHNFINITTRSSGDSVIQRNTANHWCWFPQRVSSVLHGSSATQRWLQSLKSTNMARTSLWTELELWHRDTHSTAIFQDNWVSRYWKVCITDFVGTKDLSPPPIFQVNLG